MLYHLVRVISGIALRWFYARVDVEGLDRLRDPGPVLLAVNHPNAVVDAMVVGCVFPRRMMLTAKAPLFDNPLLGAFLRAVGVVPLIRAQDARAAGAEGRERNETAFAELNAALARGDGVLIFPEGVTGDRTSLAPIRTGAARIALQARDAGVRDLRIVPIGLTFERKDVPRSRVLVRVGDPIDVASWQSASPPSVAALTAEIETRLRAITLNFPTVEDAVRASGLASTFARLFRGAEGAPVSRPHAPLADQFSITRRIEDVRMRLPLAPPDVKRRVEELLARLQRFDDALHAHRVAIEDVEIAIDAASGWRRVLLESPVVLFAGPFALWGWLNHLLPFDLSRAIAMRSVKSDADPAMRTIVIGLGLVLLFYGLQGAVVWWLFGAIAAVVYWVSLPVTADVNFYFRERLARVLRRARAYFLFRRDPRLQARLVEELQWLKVEAAAIAGHAAFAPPQGSQSAQRV